ncbi:Protein of unknown function [Cotesia congregata]|uniref:Uncharacterized protein n=1 Tax=Cotesia congregata TaxID=51543 RepID=A0A8J2MNB3_COTCN|nr:Protein of unknown function [Cotesia congregata]
MERLGSKIEELAEFIKDKRNVHHELRKIVASITYADLLTEIKAEVSPVETGVDIRSIKKTEHGGVLLEMSRKTEDSKAFTDAVKSATANIGTVKTLTPTATIEILDLDEISTESEVREALKREFTDSLEVKRANLTKPTPRGNRAAFCELDEPSAIKALDKARIPQSTCRSHERSEMTRILQGNLNRCALAQNLLRQRGFEDKIDVCFIC